MVAGVVGPDELRPVGEAEVVAVPGLFFAAITMLAVGCLGAIAAIATGAKSPTVAVPPLLTGVAYHGLIALPLYRRGLAIGSQGPGTRTAESRVCALWYNGLPWVAFRTNDCQLTKPKIAHG